MKKIISAAFAAIILTVSLCSCSLFGSNKPALVIAGTPVDAEIYNYYLDKVTGRPADYGLDESPKKSELEDAAIGLCKRYVALNTNFALHNLTLSTSDKVNISDNVNNHWMRFRNHYESISVSKQTLTKVFTSDAYEDAIFSAIYDRGVTDSAQEKEIKDYFYKNYTAFRSVCEYFTKDDGTTVTESEKQEIINNFNRISALSGDTAESYTQACNDLGYYSSDVVIIGRTSEGYPDGFFESVYAQSDNSVRVTEYDDCVFAVRKESLKELGESVFAAYRSSLIKEMYNEEWQNTLDEFIERFTLDSKNI